MPNKLANKFSQKIDLQIFVVILNYFVFLKFRMACKRSSVRLRYSPPDYQALTNQVSAFLFSQTSHRPPKAV